MKRLAIRETTVKMRDPTRGSPVEEPVEWIHQFMQWLVHVTDTLGYFGIFIMTFIDATIVPLPVEATMIPAGYLVHQGRMEFMGVLFVSVLGTCSGAYLNYWLAKKYGRGIFIRYGKFLGVTDAKLAKLEKFFAEHGAMSTFTGRLFPGLRHYISVPAGLALMDLKKFFIYSGLGSLVLMTLLLSVGYYIGANEGEVRNLLPWIKVGLVAFIVLLVGVYVLRDWRKRKAASKI
jgi:membrane protein DedA with SNARE-associated domain